MNGPADLQKPWHEFIGNYFSNTSILDIGSGQGLSKQRLSINNNQVVTSDINRNLMLQVDIISDPKEIYGLWDLVTAFDVIEHIPRPIPWLLELKRLASDYVFLTTPNVLVYSNPWHYDYQYVRSMIWKVFSDLSYCKIFARYKRAESDKIREWDEQNIEEVNYFGFLISGMK